MFGLGLGRLGASGGALIRQILSMPSFDTDGKLVANGWVNVGGFSTDVVDYLGSPVTLLADVLPINGARYADIGGGAYDVYYTDTAGADITNPPSMGIY